MRRSLCYFCFTRCVRPTLLAAAHTLKGVAGNLGLIPLSNARSDTVALLRAEQYVEAVASCAKIRDADTGFIEIIRLLEEA